MPAPSTARSSVLNVLAGGCVLWGAAVSLRAEPPAASPGTSTVRSGAASPGPQVGQTAAEFTLSDLDGKPVSLASARADGPVVLIVLRGYPGYQCPLCTKQVGSFLGRAKEFRAAGAEVLLIYPGPADGLTEKAREFVPVPNLPESFTFLPDPDYAITDAYGLRWDADGETSYPSTFVIDRSGKVVYAKVSGGHGDRSDVETVLAAIPKG